MTDVVDHLRREIAMTSDLAQHISDLFTYIWQGNSGELWQFSDAVCGFFSERGQQHTLSRLHRMGLIPTRFEWLSGRNCPKPPVHRLLPLTLRGWRECKLIPSPHLSCLTGRARLDGSPELRRRARGK